jgi:putative addiction module CopG family antidote
MDTMNISLPPAMAEFVRSRVERDYGNASEYFRDLIRSSMQREIAEDLALLAATGKGAKPGPTDEEVEEVVALQKQLRRGRRARGV